MNLRRRIDALPPTVRIPALNLAVLVLYAGSEWLGLKFTYVNGYASPVWPPSGVALAALVLLGWEVIPGIFLASFVNISYGNVPLMAAFGISVGNLAQAILGGWLLRRVGFHAALERVKDVILLALLGAVASPALGALVGNFSMAAVGTIPWSGFWKSTWIWWVGDALGVLVAAPVLMTIYLGRWPGRRRLPEGLFIAVATLVLSYLIFGGHLGQGAFQFSLAYTVFPLGLWAAHRHGSLGAAFATALTAVAAVMGTIQGTGPFASGGSNEGVLLMATFFCLLGLSNLLLAASAAERRAGERERLKQTRLIELSPETIGMASPDGRVVLLNRAGRELLGLPLDGELHRFSVLRLLDPRERPRFLSQVLPEIRRKGSWSGDIALQHQISGDSIPTRQFLFPIDDPRAGTTVAYGCIGHDLREAQRVEASLRQTQRLESLGVLTGGIAHDFNNLLTAMIGNLELATLHVEEDQPVAPYLKNLAGLLERSSTLTRQMLAYAGRGKVEVSPLDLGQLVQDLSELLQVSISKKADLHVEVAPDLPLIPADRTQVEQVVMNLVINASEALGEKDGSITLRVQAQQFAPAELAHRFPGQNLRAAEYVVLEAADTGMGMSAEVLDRIFDPFFTTKFQGRGLGLSAIRGILRAHGGGIQVVSHLGVGTTFTLAFPALGALADAVATPDEPTKLLPSLTSGEIARLEGRGTSPG
ncbi:MAG TPA: MASE1 domain-containing protein [Holophagaceae bacterium]|nr:MASE1 domain-containing protein [Holophagaceae bacterium]